MMKNILLVLLIGFMMVACSESSNSVEPTPEIDKITFTSSTNLAPTFDVEGGTVSISFTASKSWTASLVNNRADAWCKVEPTSGSAGSNTISIKVAPNEEPDDRSAVVQIKSGNATETINVSQKQKNALTLTSNKYEVDAKGGSVEVEIKANVKYSYSIDEAAKEWITYESSRALSTSYLKFKVSPNEALTTREGTITISDGTLSETVTVYQQGEKPSIIISQKEYTIGADADTIQVEVSSNVNVEIQMPDVDWIAENQSRAYSTNTYHFLVSANGTYDNRSAEIVFKNTENNLEEKVAVNQMQRNAIVLAKNEYTLEKEACHLDFDIQANVDFEVKVEGEWIKQVQSRGLESHSLYFDIAENTGDDEREGNIVISSGDIEQVIKVIQRGKGVDVEKIAEYVVEVSEKVDPLFMECETIEELASHLDEIKSLDGVTDAWVTNTALFVETKGGFPLSWLYTPDVDAEEMEEMLATISHNELIASRSTAWNEHVSMEDSTNTVCLINQTVNDEDFAVVKGCLDDIETKFENAGFNVDLRYGERANLDFFTSKLTANDIILIITHGGFDGKRHWLLTGEIVTTSTAEDRIISLIGKNDVNEGELRDKYGIGFSTIKEKRAGSDTEVRYIMFSEECVEENLPVSEKGCIVFCGACQSLKGNNDLANAFIKKGARLYLGYDETNGVAHKAGPEFYKFMLVGEIAKDAFDKMNVRHRVDEQKKKKITANLKIVGDENVCIVHPTVFTLDATNIGNSTITLNGEVKGWRGLDGDIGFCYSKDVESLDIENGSNHTEVCLTSENNMCDVKVESMSLENLEFGVTYYYRTYICVNGQYIYGDVKSFTTGEVEPVTIAEAVDLGLSVLWASHNVGATKPEEYGDYYAWGETEKQYCYFKETYSFYDVKTKSYENIGTNISGTSYDVAHVKWGDGWRLPTKDEVTELVEKCKWKRHTYNDVKGVLVTGPNGNSVFFPFAGWRLNGNTFYASGMFDTWSGTLNADYKSNEFAYTLSFDVVANDWIEERHNGYPVRPVKN